MYRQTNGALLREVYPPVGPCSKAPPPPDPLLGIVHRAPSCQQHTHPEPPHSPDRTVGCGTRPPGTVRAAFARGRGVEHATARVAARRRQLCSSSAAAPARQRPSQPASLGCVSLSAVGNPSPNIRLTSYIICHIV